MPQSSPELQQNPPSRQRAAAVLRAFEHRHSVVHLLYTAADQADATRRIAQLLELDEPTAAAVLDLPLRRMLPEERARLDKATAPTHRQQPPD